MKDIIDLLSINVLIEGESKSLELNSSKHRTIINKKSEFKDLTFTFK